MTDLQARFDAVAVNRLLGLKLQRAESTGATIELDPLPAMTQEYGVVHGGLLASLADTAAVYAVHPFLGPGERMTSIEFKINFLAAARPGLGTIVATSTVIKRGRTVAVVSVDVKQGESLIATGLFTYIVLPAAT